MLEGERPFNVLKINKMLEIKISSFISDISRVKNRGLECDLGFEKVMSRRAVFWSEYKRLLERILQGVQRPRV